MSQQQLNNTNNNNQEENKEPSVLGRRGRFAQLMDEQEQEVEALRVRERTLTLERDEARAESAARLGRINQLESSLAAQALLVGSATRLQSKLERREATIAQLSRDVIADRDSAVQAETDKLTAERLLAASQMEVQRVRNESQAAAERASQERSALLAQIEQLQAALQARPSFQVPEPVARPSVVLPPRVEENKKERAFSRDQLLRMIAGGGADSESDAAVSGAALRRQIPQTNSDVLSESEAEAPPTQAKNLPPPPPPQPTIPIIIPALITRQGPEMVPQQAPKPSPVPVPVAPAWPPSQSVQNVMAERTRLLNEKLKKQEEEEKKKEEEKQAEWRRRADIARQVGGGDPDLSDLLLGPSSLPNGIMPPLSVPYVPMVPPTQAQVPINYQPSREEQSAFVDDYPAIFSDAEAHAPLPFNMDHLIQRSENAPPRQEQMDPNFFDEFVQDSEMEVLRKMQIDMCIETLMQGDLTITDYAANIKTLQRLNHPYNPSDFPPCRNEALISNALEAELNGILPPPINLANNEEEKNDGGHTMSDDSSDISRLIEDERPRLQRPPVVAVSSDENDLQESVQLNPIFARQFATYGDAPLPNAPKKLRGIEEPIPQKYKLLSGPAASKVVIPATSNVHRYAVTNARYREEAFTTANYQQILVANPRVKLMNFNKWQEKSSIEGDVQMSRVGLANYREAHLNSAGAGFYCTDITKYLWCPYYTEFMSQQDVRSKAYLQRTICTSNRELCDKKFIGFTMGEAAMVGKLVTEQIRGGIPFAIPSSVRPTREFEIIESQTKGVTRALYAHQTHEVAAPIIMGLEHFSEGSSSQNDPSIYSTGPQTGRTYMTTIPVIPLVGNHCSAGRQQPYRDIQSHFINLFNETYDYESSCYSIAETISELYMSEKNRSVSITAMAIFLDALTTQDVSDQLNHSKIFYSCPHLRVVGGWSHKQMQRERRDISDNLHSLIPWQVTPYIKSMFNQPVSMMQGFSTQGDPLVSMMGANNLFDDNVWNWDGENQSMHPLSSARNKVVYTFVPFLVEQHWMVAILVDNFRNGQTFGNDMDVIVYDPSYVDSLAPANEVKYYLGSFVDALTEMICSIRPAYRQNFVQSSKVRFHLVKNFFFEPYSTVEEQQNCGHLCITFMLYMWHKIRMLPTSEDFMRLVRNMTLPFFYNDATHINTMSTARVDVASFADSERSYNNDKFYERLSTYIQGMMVTWAMTVNASFRPASDLKFWHSLPFYDKYLKVIKMDERHNYQTRCNLMAARFNLGLALDYIDGSIVGHVTKMYPAEKCQLPHQVGAKRAANPPSACWPDSRKAFESGKTALEKKIAKCVNGAATVNAKRIFIGYGLAPYAPEGQRHEVPRFHAGGTMSITEYFATQRGMPADSISHEWSKRAMGLPPTYDDQGYYQVLCYCATMHKLLQRSSQAAFDYHMHNIMGEGYMIRMVSQCAVVRESFLKNLQIMLLGTGQDHINNSAIVQRAFWVCERVLRFVGSKLPAYSTDEAPPRIYVNQQPEQL